MHDKLSTLDKISYWRLDVDPTRRLYATRVDSKLHLFFSCPFGLSLWPRVLLKSSIHRPISNWQGKQSWALSNLKGKAIQIVLLKLCWHALVYHICRERNLMIFAVESHSEARVWESVVTSVHGRFLSVPDLARRVRTFEQKQIFASWGLSPTI